LLLVRGRVRDDFRGAVKAAVATTSTLFAAAERHTARSTSLLSSG
jgi:hypothetical protein